MYRIIARIKCHFLAFIAKIKWYLIGDSLKKEPFLSYTAKKLPRLMHMNKREPYVRVITKRKSNRCS